METQTPAADAVSTPTTPATEPAANTEAKKAAEEKKERAPNHSALSVLGRALRLRNEYGSSQDPRVKEDVIQLANAISEVERVSQLIPQLHADTDAAKADRKTRRSAVKGRITMLTVALKLRPEGKAIVEASRDPEPALFAEMLCNRIPDNFLGVDQGLVGELEKDNKRLHLAGKALEDKEAALAKAVEHYKHAVRVLGAAISQLLASVRGYQARLKLDQAA